MTRYSGSCHCGKVQYRAELDLTSPVLECNCSHCERKWFLLSFIPETQFELSSGESDMTEYRFNTHKITHLFCAYCGVQCFGKAAAPDGTETIAVNVRTVEGINISTLTRQAYDGKSV